MCRLVPDLWISCYAWSLTGEVPAAACMAYAVGYFLYIVALHSP